jgi:hypothetical protein
MEENRIDKNLINKLYTAYGSNLNLSQMKVRCPSARVIGRSEIKDYELVFKGSKTNAVATIEPCEGSKVPVLIWDIQDEDEKALDRYEGYPNFYGKEEMEIIIEDNPISAMVYVMTPGHDYGKPSEYYLETIEKGYADSGFDKDILYKSVENSIDKMQVNEEMMEGTKEDEFQKEINQIDISEMKWW